MTDQPKETTVGDKVAATIRGVLSTHVDMSEYVMCCQVWRDGPGHVEHVADELLVALAARPVAAQERERDLSADYHERLLRYLLRQYDSLVEVHEQVVMDTPEDRDLHDRAVAQFREAADPVRRALTGDDEPAPRFNCLWCGNADGYSDHHEPGCRTLRDASPTEPTTEVAGNELLLPRPWLDEFAEEGVPKWAALRAWEEAKDDETRVQIKARARKIAEAGR